MEYLSPGTMTSPTTTVAKALINTIISQSTQAMEMFDSKSIQRISKPQTVKGKAEAAKQSEPKNEAPETQKEKQPDQEWTQHKAKRHSCFTSHGLWVLHVHVIETQYMH